MYDLIIIGGGPAGTAAGVYAARKRLKTLLITPEFGGQSNVSPDIQNWIGTVSIPGLELAKDFKKHLEAYADDVLDIVGNEKVEKVEKEGETFTVTTNKGAHEAKTVLVATGSHRRKLTVPGAEEYENKGITYCATCDGPMFSGKDVVVIGGGNAGFETAAQLLAYTKSVTLLNFSDAFKADEITVNKVLSHENMTGVNNAETVEIKGEKFVTSITYKDTKTGEVTELPTGGIFVEIGLIPSTEFVKGLVDLNKNGAVVIDPRTQQTSVAGLWSAGDCTDVLYHQNNIAAGDAVRALEDIYMYIHTR